MLFINDQIKFRFLVILVSVAAIFYSCKDSVEEAPVYISEVFDYVYAPGQHAALAKLSDIQFFIGNPEEHQGWLYLGGFGGYVIAGFPRNIVNAEGLDFEVFALKGAAPEPAVVWVMQDENGDGLPNDTWYELKGSLFEQSERNYEITYYRAESATSNILWRDHLGNSGELRSGFGGAYSAHWWWNETLNDSIRFVGTRLPDGYVNTPVNGTDHWSVPDLFFEWGYAENSQGSDYINATGANQFDISNAVDAQGNPVDLSHIRFIKVQTAVLQQAGWTNEVSSELRGARSLR